jgi:tryptophan synthase alpha chain
MNGIERIAAAFAAVHAQGRAALMPYVTLGYPRRELSLDVVEAVATCGADLIELGVPFSDPLADGPTIQRSTQVALEEGMTLAGCLEMVAGLRGRGISTPFMLMGYVNPILAYGVRRFTADAAQAGADGVIVPDLPPEEAGELEQACRENGLVLVYLVPPTASLERIGLISARSNGFLYLVSLTGVTGARHELPADLARFIQRVRQVTRLPLAVGFGISTPEQARAVGSVADGVIVGSALIDVIGKAADPVRAAGDFVRALRQGITMRG